MLQKLSLTLLHIELPVQVCDATMLNSSNPARLIKKKNIKNIVHRTPNHHQLHLFAGASHPEELFEQAAALVYAAIALTVRNTFAGIVQAQAAAKKIGDKIDCWCAA